MNSKELFNEYFDNRGKVLDDLMGYIFERKLTINSISSSIGISPVTLTRILRQNKNMVFSTWCKIKGFLDSVPEKK